MRRTTSADKSALVWQVRKGSIDSPCNLWHLLWRWKPLTHITGTNPALYAAYDIVDELLAEVWLQKPFISEVLYMCCVLKWICNNSSSFREPNEIIALTLTNVRGWNRLTLYIFHFWNPRQPMNKASSVLKWIIRLQSCSLPDNFFNFFRLEKHCSGHVAWNRIKGKGTSLSERADSQKINCCGRWIYRAFRTKLLLSNLWGILELICKRGLSCSSLASGRKSSRFSSK